MKISVSISNLGLPQFSIFVSLVVLFGGTTFPTGDADMDVTATIPETGFRCSEYKSPRRALVRSFVLSRNRWKAKALDRKVEIKRLQNHVASLRRGRDEWKGRVQVLEEQLAQAQARTSDLEQQLAAVRAQKKLS